MGSLFPRACRKHSATLARLQQSAARVEYRTKLAGRFARELARYRGVAPVSAEQSSQSPPHGFGKRTCGWVDGVTASAQ
eukprot:2876703-Pyramimonas_sp.AAC.1